ncbi:hypothetical protein AOLI_G00034750 [Acnodon oligacanthus]
MVLAFDQLSRCITLNSCTAHRQLQRLTGARPGPVPTSSIQHRKRESAALHNSSRGPRCPSAAVVSLTAASHRPPAPTAPPPHMFAQ